MRPLDDHGRDETVGTRVCDMIALSGFKEDAPETGASSIANPKF